MKGVDTMKEKKTFVQQLKDWWNEHKREIKVGIAFGTLGVAYGMFKGYATADKMWMDHGFTHIMDNPELPDDELDLTENNCDDPELLEIVKSENENS